MLNLSPREKNLVTEFQKPKMIESLLVKRKLFSEQMF